MTFSPESFGLGLLAGLIVLAIVWLCVDRAALKARLAAFEAKEAPVLKHDLHVVEALPKVAVSEVEALLAKLKADLLAEVAKKESVAAVPTPPAAPQA